jgi:hypothetical protein
MSNTLTQTATLQYDPAIGPTPRTMKIVKQLAVGSGVALSLIGGTWPIPEGFSGTIALPPLNGLIAGFVMRNDSNQALGVMFNGPSVLFNLPPGAETFQLNPSVPAVPLTQISLATTTTQGAGANQIHFYLVERA